MSTSSDGVVLIASAGAQIYLSKDGGLSWDIKQPGYGYYDILSVSSSANGMKYVAGTMSYLNCRINTDGEQ